MKVRIACLTTLAGLCFGASALAQEFGPLPIRQVTLPVIGAPAQPYTDRVIDTTYDNLTGTFGNGSALHLGACSQIVEDISFAGSAWNSPPYATPRIITEITYGVGVLTTASVAATQNILLIFWDEDDLNFLGSGGAGTSMITPNAAPLAVVRVDLGAANPGFYYQVTNALTGLAGGGVTVPADDNGIALQVAWVTDQFTPADTNGDTIPNWENLAGGLVEGCASTTDRALVFGNQSGAPVGGNAASPGTTSTSYGRDISNAAMCPNIGFFLGAAQAAGGNVEHRTVANAPVQRGYMVRLRGDVIAQAPPCDTVVTLTDAGYTDTSTLAAGQVKIYCVDVAAAATDAAGTFLDATLGGATDGSIAIFNNGGGVIASDDDDGPGTDAQLTLGIGRREKDGDLSGLQYNGRDGELAAGGRYYVMVATGAAGANSFGGGFSRSSTGPGGSVTLNIRTNVGGTPLAVSVPPDLNEPAFGDMMTPIAAPGFQTTAVGSGLRGLLWYKFSTCAITSPTSFLDFGMAGSTASADSEIFVFDNTGALVATDDDGGPAALSQLSFGDTTTPRSSGGGDTDFQGQNGDLAEGMYYIGLGLFDVSTTNNRWHLRATSGSNLILAVVATTNSDGACGGPAGCYGTCVADFDDGTFTGMPDGGVTIDDLLYYLFLFEDGNVCADVDDGTFTNTLDGGVTIDDLLYFLFRFDAGC